MSTLPLATLEFSQPTWLLGGLILLPWLIYVSARSLVDASARQRWLSLIMRAVLILLLSTAAAGLTWYGVASERYVVLAVDRSQSVSPSQAEHANEVVEAFRRNHALHGLAIMDFAAEPGPVRETTSAKQQMALQQNDSLPTLTLDTLGTDLAAAIDMACAAIPPNYVPHVVLVTDGLQTEGDALASAKASTVPISTIALPASEQPEVQVSEVSVPAEVQVGEPFYVEIIVGSNTTASAEVELYRNDFRVELDESTVQQVQPGENRWRLRQQLDEPQSAVYTARVQASSDSQLDNNVASGLVIAAGNPRILLVDSDPASLDAFRWALEDQQMTVDVVAANGVPDSLSGMLSYDAIVLSDVPAADFSLTQQDGLRRYVEDLGGGLLMLGGEESFGLGGYDQSPLAAVLPVRSDPQRDREKPSLAMVLVIDRSGSMGGLKIDLAKDAARGVVELLGPRDQIGVVAFDDDAYWISPLRSAAERVSIVNNIDRLSSAGGTNLYPPMAEAFAALRTTPARLKHVIVLSDGISAPADFDRLTADMVADQITVSTVAVGDMADRSRLRRIAQQGRGRYYECVDPRSVPQVFAQEALIASKSAIDEQPCVPQAARATAVLRGIDLDALPVLLGHVVTRPQPTSEVILVSENGDPLLAWWRFGLGKSLAFTSDVKNRWAAEWLTWPEFSAFWVQCVRHVMRKHQHAGGSLEVTSRRGKMRVVLELAEADDTFVNRAQTRVSVVSPDDPQHPREYMMPQVGPGIYAAELEGAVRGPYYLDVISQLDGQIKFRQAIGTFVGYPDELRLRPVDEVLLRELADAANGLVNPSVDQVLNAPTIAGSRAVPLWPVMVGLALFLLVADVALRRLSRF